MKDRLGRTIDYLRISVTDRCNLRCTYCMPAGGMRLLPREEILSFEEIEEVARAAAGMGVTKLRLSGGEPLLRRDLAVLVGMLARIEGVRDLAMTTNGLLLAEHARALARAGLARVNVSLDAVRPERYAEFTRGGDVREPLAGIEAARAAGLEPVKLNCVVAESPAEPDAQEVARFACERGLEVRFIHRMHPATGRFSVVRSASGESMPGAGGDCPRCNRLRLTANGLVRPCLFADLSFSVRELGAREALERAVREKPEAGGPCSLDCMARMGG